MYIYIKKLIILLFLLHALLPSIGAMLRAGGLIFPSAKRLELELGVVGDAFFFNLTKKSHIGSVLGTLLKMLLIVFVPIRIIFCRVCSFV